MKIKILIPILMFIFFSVNVIAIEGGAIYNSPIVTGQYNDYYVDNNLILGTQISTIHQDSLTECIFSGSGDGDYRYLNVDEFGQIFLTDDDFISIFDSDCNLLATHTINGTLMSQPYVFDSEGDGFTNIFYISAVGTDNQINEYELVNDVIISPVPNQFILKSGGLFCYGLYCDPSKFADDCATFCGTDWEIFEVTPLGQDHIELSVGTQGGCSQSTVYDEVNDKVVFNCGAGESTDFLDRSFPAIYGMDIDTDGNTEVISIHVTDDGANPREWAYSSIDLENMAIDTEIDEISYITAILGQEVDISGSGGTAIIGNIGDINGNGEIFLSYVEDIDRKHIHAEIFNSVGSSIKTIINNQDDVTNFHLSNFAVADIDYDLKNDYCIALNDSAIDNLDHIYCYSGDNVNTPLTNCTISGWDTNNPITISLMVFGESTSQYMNLITTFGIFQLDENNGGTCNNVKPDGWTGLSSSSEGALVPVDVSGDDKPDLIYYGADGARLYKSGIIELPEYPEGSPFECSDHALLCDNFNYDFPLFFTGWRVSLNNLNHNATIKPIDFRINDTSANYHDYNQLLEPVPVNYITSVTESTTASFLHPVVSHEYELKLTANNGRFFYEVENPFGEISISVMFEGQNISYYDRDLEGFTLLGSINSFTPNITHDVKIIEFYGLDTIDFSNKNFNIFPFNVSVQQAFYNVYIDNIQIGGDVLFRSNESHFPIEMHFIKERQTATAFTMDNLNIYRGTDPITDNSELFYVDLFINYSATERTDINETADLMTPIITGLEQMGILSTASKMLIAMLIILFSVVGIAIGLGKAGVGGIAISIISVVVMVIETIFFTVFGLIPLWVLFALFLIGAGGTFLFIRISSSSG